MSLNPIQILLALIFLSVFLPIPASYYDQAFFKFLPLAGLSALFLCYCLHSRVEFSTCIYFVSLALSHFINLNYAIFHPFGYTIVIAQGWLVFKIFESCLFEFGFKKLIGLITVAGFLVSITAIVEWGVILAGYQFYLEDTLNSVIVRDYKVQNSAAFLNFIFGSYDLKGEIFYGANGPSLGSQSLSQLISIVFVLSTALSKSCSFSMKRALCIFFSCILLLSCLTMTASITIVIIFIYLIYFDRGSFFFSKKIQFGALFIFIAGFQVVVPLIFYRIRNMNDVTEYLVSYNLFHIFDFSNVMELMFGTQNNFLYYSDFGFLGLAYFGGGALFLLWHGFLLLEAFRSHMIRKKLLEVRVKLCGSACDLYRLNQISFLSVGVCVMGLVHYTPSLELGVGQVFSFFLGLLIYTSRKILDELNRFGNEE